MTTNPIHLLVLIFLSFRSQTLNPAMRLGIHSTTEDPLWYPDSGATHHVTKDPTVYSTKQPYNGTEIVKMGNGSGLFIANTGSAIFRSSLMDKPLLLRNLLHVPLITKNLLSFLSLLVTIMCIFNSMLTIVVLLIRLRTKFFFAAFLRMVSTLFQPCTPLICPLFFILLLLIINS